MNKPEQARPQDVRIYAHAVQCLRDVQADLLWVMTRVNDPKTVQAKVSAILYGVGKAIEEADKEQLRIEHERNNEHERLRQNASRPYIPVTEEGKRALARLSELAPTIKQGEALPLFLENATIANLPKPTP